jgi:hypothetical protein
MQAPQPPWPTSWPTRPDPLELRLSNTISRAWDQRANTKAPVIRRFARWLLGLPLIYRLREPCSSRNRQAQAQHHQTATTKKQPRTGGTRSSLLPLADKSGPMSGIQKRT